MYHRKLFHVDTCSWLLSIGKRIIGPVRPIIKFPSSDSLTHSTTNILNIFNSTRHKCLATGWNKKLRTFERRRCVESGPGPFTGYQWIFSLHGLSVPKQKHSLSKIVRMWLKLLNTQTKTLPLKNCTNVMKIVEHPNKNTRSEQSYECGWNVEPLHWFQKRPKLTQFLRKNNAPDEISSGFNAVDMFSM